MSTVNEIIAVPTVEEVFSHLLDLLKGLEFPVESWATGSVPRHLVQMEALYLQDLHQLVANVAAGGFLRTATGDWLTLLADNFFNVQRYPATYTEGIVVISVPSTVSSPVTIRAGEFWVGTGNQSYRYVAIDDVLRTRLPVTIQPSHYSAITVKAESTGSDYNTVNYGITEVLTPGGTGSVVTNPVYGSTSTWTTVPGQDEESDALLQLRCLDQWSTLGSGSNDAAYRYHVRKASSLVEKINVISNRADGSVTIYVATTTGTLPIADLAAIGTEVETYAPLTVKTSVYNVIMHEIIIYAIVYYKPGYNPTLVEATVKVSLGKYCSELKIGGTVYMSAIIATIMDTDGVQWVNVVVPSDNYTLASSNMAFFSIQLILVAGN